MPELLGLIGALVVCAGIHLLWQARKEIFFWLETFVRIFRASLAQPGARVRPLGVETAPRDRHLLRMLLGMGLLFFQGPMLIVLSLTL